MIWFLSKYIYILFLRRSRKEQRHWDARSVVLFRQIERYRQKKVNFCWKTLCNLKCPSNLNNYSKFHVCLSVCPSGSVCPFVHFFLSGNLLKLLQLFQKMSLIKVPWDIFRVKNIHSGSPSEPACSTFIRESRVVLLKLTNKHVIL